jgi:hypothetical protein
MVYKDWVISPYVLSLHGLPLTPCIFVMVIQAQSYFAATMQVMLLQVLMNLIKDATAYFPLDD